MIIVLTGQPRHGKSQYSIKLLLDLIEENRKREEGGKLARDIYCNIAGVNDPDTPTKLPEVMNQDIVFKDKKLWFGEHKDCPEGYVCPNSGSVFIYDECHKVDWIREASGTLSTNPTCISMNEHGHEDYIFILITQFPQYIHTHLRGLVELHYHSKRSFGASRSKIYKWNEFCLNPRAEKSFKDAYEKETFKFHKKYQDCYKSASAHDSMKLHIPMPLIYLVVALVAIFSLAYWQFTKSPILHNSQPQQADKPQSKAVNNPMQSDDEPPKDEDLQKEQENKIAQRRVYLLAQDLPQDYEIRRTEPMLQVRGVMQMGDKCLAYNAYGDVMTLSQSDCKSYVGTGRVYRAEAQSTQTIQPQPQTITEPPPQPQQPQNNSFVASSTNEPIFADNSKSEYIFHK